MIAQNISNSHQPQPSGLGLIWWGFHCKKINVIKSEVRKEREKSQAYTDLTWIFSLEAEFEVELSALYFLLYKPQRTYDIAWNIWWKNSEQKHEWGFSEAL